MSWNDPKNQNGQGNKDPWGRRGQNDGPPDLDEVFRQWQAKLRGILGGGQNGGSGSGAGRSGGSKPFGNIGIGIAAIIFFGIYALMGIFVVEPAEQAVITRFGQYNRSVEAGPHWLAPLIEKKQIVNVQKVDTSKHGGLMLTEDKNIVSVEVAAQFRVQNARDFLFNVRDPIKSLQQVSESALRAVVGQSVMDEVLASGRGLISDDVLIQIQKNMDMYGAGIEVVDLAMLPSKPPEQVKAAFDDAIKAGQDQQRLINEAEAYANKIVPIAEGRAKRVFQEADAYKQQVILDASGQTTRFNALLPEYKKAPEVTRDRLYLDAMQEVYANSNKILVDVEGGNNLFYMPLDKIAARLPSIVNDDDENNSDVNSQSQLTDNRQANLGSSTRQNSRPGYRDLIRSSRSGG
jgi:membrane protease subunit HflK